MPYKKISEESIIAESVSKTTEKLKDLITHSSSVEIIDSIKVKYKNIKGKRLKLLLLALQQTELIPKERIAKKFHDCCIIEFDWEIATYNVYEELYSKHFKTHYNGKPTKRYLKLLKQINKNVRFSASDIEQLFLM